MNQPENAIHKKHTPLNNRFIPIISRQMPKNTKTMRTNVTRVPHLFCIIQVKPDATETQHTHAFASVIASRVRANIKDDHNDNMKILLKR